MSKLQQSLAPPREHIGHDCVNPLKAALRSFSPHANGVTLAAAMLKSNQKQERRKNLQRAREHHIIH